MACLYEMSASPRASFAPTDTVRTSPSVGSAGYVSLNHLTSSAENNFQIGYHSVSWALHISVSLSLRASACDAKPPHLVVAMLANQHWNSFSKVAASVKWYGWFQSSLLAVL